MMPDCSPCRLRLQGQPRAAWTGSLSATTCSKRSGVTTTWRKMPVSATMGRLPRPRRPRKDARRRGGSSSSSTGRRPPSTPRRSYRTPGRRPRRSPSPSSPPRTRRRPQGRLVVSGPPSGARWPAVSAVRPRQLDLRTVCTERRPCQARQAARTSGPWSYSTRTAGTWTRPPTPSSGKPRVLVRSGHQTDHDGARVQGNRSLNNRCSSRCSSIRSR
mmetsp:Transcript_37431/g.89732  ORF Transcript_37431/g.89732 Transcript_37431/m.89732 type:complete len:216 (+) Transcript_37431:124-771(+)